MDDPAIARCGAVEGRFAFQELGESRVFDRLQMLRGDRWGVRPRPSDTIDPFLRAMGS
jgi:hypothetical protein